MTNTVNPAVKAFFDQETNTVSYVVKDPRSSACAIIDSVLDYDAASGRVSQKSADQVIDYVRTHQLTVVWLLETHVHADHLSAAPLLQEKLGGKVGIGEKICVVQNVFGKIFNAGTDFQRDGSQFDRLFKEGDSFEIGALQGRVLHTPGHTPACLTYVIGDAAFVGDTLFMPDFGTARCDFPGGDAHEMYKSVQKIFALPDETRVFTCHDYKAPGRDIYAWESTVGEQKRKNIQINQTVNEGNFVQSRKNRDATLNMPKLILPSVQVNMRAGRFPAKEENGVSYLKIPINQF